MPNKPNKRKRKARPGWSLPALRQRACRTQKGLCYWCGQQMKPDAESTDPLRLTADHLVPVYAGGSTRPGNIVAACARCNNSRQVETNRRKLAEARPICAGDETTHSPFAVLKLPV
jgi:5-methylcytosine-specific restriction endonuclease McrA